MAQGTPFVLTPKSENPRVQKIAKKERAAVVDGKPVSKLKQYTIRRRHLRGHYRQVLRGSHPGLLR